MRNPPFVTRCNEEAKGVNLVNKLLRITVNRQIQNNESDDQSV